MSLSIYLPALIDVAEAMSLNFFKPMRPLLHPVVYWRWRTQNQPMDCYRRYILVGLRGETEPLRRLGIDVSAGMVASLVGTDVTEDEKVAGRAEAIVRQTKNLVA